MLRPAGIFLAFFIMGASLQAQFNAYKYVVVPTHFEGYPKPNQYQTSTVIKYFLTEYGYPAVYDAQQPTELRVQPCLGVFARLHDTSGMFVTRVTLEFVDCEGKQVFQTLEGSSRQKDYVQAYKEAIQNAFLSLSGRTYSYHPVATPVSKPAAQPTPAAVQAEPPPVATPVPAEKSVAAVTAAVSTPEPVAEAAPEAAPAAAEIAIEVAEEASPVRAVAAGSASEPETWYAQPIANGFQLVDSTPKIRMKLVNTSRKDTYIALVDDQARGSVYLEDGVWIHEYFEGGTLFRQPLSIKF